MCSRCKELEETIRLNEFIIENQFTIIESQEQSIETLHGLINDYNQPLQKSHAPHLRIVR